MPNPLSIGSVIDKNKIASSAPFIPALEVDVIDPVTGVLQETLYLVKNNEPLWLNGIYHRPVHFDYDLSQAANEIPEVKIRVEDPTNEVTRRIDAYAGGVGFTLRFKVMNTANFYKNPVTDLGAADLEYTSQQSSIDSAALNRSADAVFAIDMDPVPDVPTGMIYEIGGSSFGHSVSFTGGNLEIRAYDGSVPYDAATCARALVDRDLLKNQAGTLFVALRYATGEAVAFWKNRRSPLLNRMVTAARGNGGGTQWAGTDGGSFLLDGGNAGVAGEGEINTSLYNGGVTRFRYWEASLDTAYFTTPEPEVEEQFYVLSAKSKNYACEFSLGARNPLRTRFPRRYQWRDRCSWKYKGFICQYEGPLATCDYTLNGPNGCVAHGNDHRFGAFPGIRNR